MSERELVQRAQSGDFDAFVTLIDAHKAKIYSLALKMTGSSQDAEDIVQDTLLKAIDNIEQYRGEAAFGTWLYSIALNQTRALLASQKRTDLKPVENYLPAAGAHRSPANGKSGLFDWKDPHHVLEQQELARTIDEALDHLPPAYREAFLLRYFEELPIKEVARLIGETVAATKSRVLRARLAMRDYLSKRFEDRHGRQMQ